jgi:hypothetical protein
MSEVNPAGTVFLNLVAELMDLVKDSNASRIEVVMASCDRDGQGKEKLVNGKMSYTKRAFAIRGMDKNSQEKIRAEVDASPISHLMVLWVQPGGLGMLRFDPVTNQKTTAGIDGCDAVEKSMIADYLNRQTAKK